MLLVCKRFMFLLLTLFIFCTHNPFSNDRIAIPPGRMIKGKVELSGHTSPSGVYVYLEEFNIGTFTNEQGEFQLTLPPPQTQGKGGISGSFKLYFFLANYEMKTVDVIIRNGQLNHSHGNIDENGMLKHPVYLPKLLHIQTRINPSVIDIEYDRSLVVDLLLQATDDTVIIRFPDKAQGPLAIIMIDRIYPEKNYFQIIEINKFALNTEMATDTITQVPKTWVAGLKLKPGQFPKGKFKIIPYFLIPQEAVPQKLLNMFGNDFYRPGRAFANFPIKREGGDFEVRGVTGTGVSLRKFSSYRPLTIHR